MATYTSNLNLKKPALDDDALITDINNNMDILDAAANGIQDALAIVATGNTHAAITSGQFVYVRNHSTLTEGLYVASSNIAANATLSSTNLTANSSGGLNTLSEQIEPSEVTMTSNTVTIAVYSCYKVANLIILSAVFTASSDVAHDSLIFTLSNERAKARQDLLIHKDDNDTMGRLVTAPNSNEIRADGAISAGSWRFDTVIVVK